MHDLEFWEKTAAKIIGVALIVQWPFFRECFYSSPALTELRSRMQTIVEACGCHASKQSDSRNWGMISGLPIPYCTNSLLYLEFMKGLPRLGGYDSCLVVTCGLSRLTRAFPCSKKITGEHTVKMLVEQWPKPYGAPKQVHSDEDVRIRSDTGWYKRVLNAVNVEVTTSVPYTHTSNPLCERQNRVVEQNLRILMKQERTKDWVRLLQWAVLTMNSQRISSTGLTPKDLFHGGRPAVFFSTPLPEDFKSPVGDWLEQKQSMANQAGTNLQHIRERELSRRNRLQRPASFKFGDLVLVNHSRLPSWPPNCLQDPYFGPYRIIRIDGSGNHVRCSPRLGGELLCASKQLRHYRSPDDLSWDEWRLSDKEVEKIDLQNAASPEEADELDEMTAEEMAVDGYYVVAGLAHHEYKQGWKLLTLWEGYGVPEATWEPMSAFIRPNGGINPVFRSYFVENNEGQLLGRAETVSQGKKKNYSPCAYLIIVPNQTEEVARFRRLWYTPDDPSSSWESPSGHFCRSIGSPRRYTSLSPRKATLGISGIPPGRLFCLQPNGRGVLLPEPPTVPSSCRVEYQERADALD